MTNDEEQPLCTTKSNTEAVWLVEEPDSTPRSAPDHTEYDVVSLCSLRSVHSLNPQQSVFKERAQLSVQMHCQCDVLHLEQRQAESDNPAAQTRTTRLLWIY